MILWDCGHCARPLRGSALKLSHPTCPCRSSFKKDFFRDLKRKSVPNLLLKSGLNRFFEVVCNLEKLVVIEVSLVCFESSSNTFHLSPNIDGSFRLSRSRYFRISKAGKHNIEFRAHEEIHTFLEVPGVLAINTS